MSALLALVPWWGRWLAIGALAVSLFGYGYVKGKNSAEEESATAQAQAFADAYHIVTKHEVEYVEHIQKIAGPIVVRDRLVRGVCEPAVGVSSESAPVKAPSGYSDAQFSDRLATDLVANAANIAQCEALIGAVNEINRHR